MRPKRSVFASCGCRVVDLRAFADGAIGARASIARTALRELHVAARICWARRWGYFSLLSRTVFSGGGTRALLAVAHLCGLLGPGRGIFRHAG